MGLDFDEEETVKHLKRIANLPTVRYLRLPINLDRLEPAMLLLNQPDAFPCLNTLDLSPAKSVSLTIEITVISMS